MPCDCLSCAGDPLLLTGVGPHKYTLDTGRDDHSWRWLCTCGTSRRAAGRWQHQSPNCAFHSWRVHAGLEVRR